MPARAALFLPIAIRLDDRAAFAEFLVVLGPKSERGNA
jgi:hypothetical protein